MRRALPCLLALFLCLAFVTAPLSACSAKKPARKVETIERMKQDGTTEEVTVVKEEKLTDTGGNGGSNVGSFLGYIIAIPVMIVGGILSVLF